MNWLKKPASPKLIKIGLAVMAIVTVVMIAFGDYLVAFGFACVFLVVFLQHRTKK